MFQPGDVCKYGDGVIFVCYGKNPVTTRTTFHSHGRTISFYNPSSFFTLVTSFFRPYDIIPDNDKHYPTSD